MRRDSPDIDAPRAFTVRWRWFAGRGQRRRRPRRPPRLRLSSGHESGQTASEFADCSPAKMGRGQRSPNPRAAVGNALLNLFGLTGSASTSSGRAWATPSSGPLQRHVGRDAWASYVAFSSHPLAVAIIVQPTVAARSPTRPSRAGAGAAGTPGRRPARHRLPGRHRRAANDFVAIAALWFDARRGNSRPTSPRARFQGYVPDLLTRRQVGAWRAA